MPEDLYFIDVKSLVLLMLTLIKSSLVAFKMKVCTTVYSCEIIVVSGIEIEVCVIELLVKLKFMTLASAPA